MASMGQRTTTTSHSPNAYAGGRNAAGGGTKTVYELVVYDEIGGWFLGSSLVRERLAYADREAGGRVDEIRVRINSPGGAVSEGVAIHNLLVGHPARVVVDVEGYALSAASVVAMAGDVIRMWPGSMLMIHSAWAVTRGDADMHDSTAAVLRTVTGSLAAIYVARTGASPEQVAKWIEAETWFDAYEATANGFADEAVEPKRKAGADESAPVEGEQVAALARAATWTHPAPLLASYRNLPAALSPLVERRSVAPHIRRKPDGRPESTHVGPPPAEASAQTAEAPTGSRHRRPARGTVAGYRPPIAAIGNRRTW